MLVCLCWYAVTDDRLNSPGISVSDARLSTACRHPSGSDACARDARSSRIGAPSSIRIGAPSSDARLSSNVVFFNCYFGKCNEVSGPVAFILNVSTCNNYVDPSSLYSLRSSMESSKKPYYRLSLILFPSDLKLVELC